MTKIGIDFSINSTAITIINDDEIRMFSFVPNYRPELSAFKTHKQITEFVEIHSYEKSQNTKDPIEDQSIKLLNADNLSNQIIEAIRPHIKGDVEIRIEGFSFGSKGNSFIDLITYNTFLKVKLIQNWGHNIRVLSPKSLKKMYTGNGNASKCDMVREFMKRDSSAFREKMVDLGLDKEGEFVINKPIDDLIDSRALAEVLLVSSQASSST
jgi:hypothetical protein